MKKWTIQEHSNYDKSFVIDGPLPLIIDNDDVWHPGVALLAEQLVSVLNEHWRALHATRCINEECGEAYDTMWNVATVECPTCGELVEEFEVFAS